MRASARGNLQFRKEKVAVRIRTTTYVTAGSRHLSEAKWQTWDQLAARYPGDHIPSPDAFASVKMHVHLFRYFNGRPGAAELRRRLNAVRTLDEIEGIVRQMAN